MNITVLGAGTIGQSWVALFLANGHHVVVYDPDPRMEAVTKQFVLESSSCLAELGYSNPSNMDRLKFISNPSDAVLGSHIIQENAPENLAIKHAIYREIESSLSPTAIICSSTSGFTLEALRDGLNDPSRLVIAHPFNPPHLMPLVEIVGHLGTSLKLMGEVKKFYESLGKTPIELKKSIPGHIANRLQAVLWQEALHLALEGVATLDEIDQVIANGPGLRWSIYGPNKLFSLAAGEEGLQGFVDQLGSSFESWWTDAGDVNFDKRVLSLVQQYDQETTPLSLTNMRTSRDALLVKILKLKLNKDLGRSQ